MVNDLAVPDPVQSPQKRPLNSYDAMATHRPYHKPRTHDEIMGVLYGQNGGKYDPYVRTLFASVVERMVYRARGG